MSPPLQGLHRSYESVRPSAPLRYSRLAVLAAWTSPLTSERLVPAVPCNRQHPLHALSTPVATRPVIRLLVGLSQIGFTHLVSTTLDFLTTRPRKVYFRSSLGCPPVRVFPHFSSNAHHHSFWPQQLGGGLRSAPESRPRGARPHRLRSSSTNYLRSCDLQ